MTQNTFSVHFIIRSDRVDKEGYVPIYTKITIRKQKILISLNQKIKASEWNKEREMPNSSCINAQELMNLIEAYKGKIFSIYSKLVASNQELTTSLFKEQFYGRLEKKEGHNLIQTTKEHNMNFEKLIDVKYSSGSYKNYKTTLKYLQEFVPLNYKKEDIPLKDVNYSFCEAYYNFLTSTKSCKTNGANKHIQRVRKIVNYAIKQGYMSSNPMATFTLKFKVFNRTALTIQEIDAIRNLELIKSGLIKARDTFLFQCYTGLAYSDVKRFSNEHLHRDEKGNYWIKMERQKTSTLFSIPLLPQAWKILKPYLDIYQGEGKILPVLSNQRMNDHLKTIQTKAGLSKYLTTHLARHSFATTITLANGVPIETVSKMLGHTKLSTTQIYAKVLDQKIEDDMEKLKGKLDK